jgi:hypothetical protein
LTPSSHVTGRPPVSISQSGVAVRRRVRVVPSKRARIESSVAGSSAMRARSKQSIERRPPEIRIR